MAISSRNHYPQEQKQRQDQKDRRFTNQRQDEEQGGKEEEMNDDNDNNNGIMIDVCNNASSDGSLGSTANDTESIVRKLYRDHCAYFIPMAGWFLFSALLSSYNKYVFGKGHMSFPCPLLLTSMHFMGQWFFSYVISESFPLYFGLDRIKPPQMSRLDYWLISIPCGIVASLDIGFSNLSMVTISLTFYTMVKSSTPVFVLIWAYLFGIGRITWHLIFVVLIIAAGEFLTVMGEFEFDGRGFVYCLLAAILSGARWTLVQLKIQSMDPPIKTTIVTMRLLSPSMCLSMLILSLCIEHPWHTLNDHFESFSQFMKIFALGGTGAVFAICMILFEFYLIMHTSAIVLMIGGVLKEMLTIIVGVSVFHDHLNKINITGCFIVFLGVIFYKLTFSIDNERVPTSKATTTTTTELDPDRRGKVYELVDAMEVSTGAEEDDMTNPLYCSDSADMNNNNDNNDMNHKNSLSDHVHMKGTKSDHMKLITSNNSNNSMDNIEMSSRQDQQQSAVAAPTLRRKFSGVE